MCVCVCVLGTVALESIGERTAEGTSTLLVYSRGGCVGIGICDIPVVKLRKWFLDKNRAGPILTHFIDNMLWKNPPGLNERG